MFFSICVAALSWPSPASAGDTGTGSRVTLQSSSLEVLGEGVVIGSGASYANDITITHGEGIAEVADTAGAWTNESFSTNSCAESSLTLVTCPEHAGVPLELITVGTGLENDTVVLDAESQVQANTTLGPGSDSFQGGPEKDTVNGYGDSLESDGIDVIRAGGGDDFVVGDFGPGHGFGEDELYGESGRDNLNGDGGDDELYGGDDRDSLFGDYENYAEPDSADIAGDDLLDGGPGDDDIFARPGQDEVYGGTGDDSIYSDGDDGAADTVSCGEGSGDFALFSENDLIGSDCEIVLLEGTCAPNQTCEALVDVTTTGDSAKRGGERLTLAEGEFKFRGTRQFRVKFKARKVKRALREVDQTGVVRKLVVVSKRKKDRDKARFELTRAN
jgi:Ca2+-binding RTX toxin-like protein